MTWVKLCGLRTAQDVAAAEKAGANAIGFVTARRSIRRVTPRRAAALGAECSLERFLVTEDETAASLMQAAADAGVSGVQPHGAHAFEAAEAALAAGLAVLFPVAVPVPGRLEIPDGAVPILEGGLPGTGATYDLEGIGQIPRPFVVAGGLTPDNVGDVVAAVRPYGVDVSSGIEKERGMKDHDLMVRFVEAAR